jgi:hypothetical protein
MGELRNARSILVGKPKGDRPLGTFRLEHDNMKTYRKEVGYEDLYWTQLTHNISQWWTLANIIMNLWVL